MPKYAEAIRRRMALDPGAHRVTKAICGDEPQVATLMWDYIDAEGDDSVALNARQELFCLEYIKDGNATQAAIRAGYSEKTANPMGARLLAKVSIRERIDELMAGVEQDKIADAEEVLRYLTSVMRGEITEEVIIGSQQGPASIQKQLSGREQVKAAELLAKRYGLLTENVKLSGGLPVQIIDDIAKGQDPNE